MKIIVTIIPIDLVKIYFYPLFALSYKVKTKSGFQQVGGLVTGYAAVFWL